MAVFSAVKLLIILTFLDTVLLQRPENHPKCNMGQFIPKFAKKVRKTDLKVVYGNHEVKCGESIDLLTVSNTPTISYDLTGKCNYATVIEISPDAFLFRPYILYLVHNIPVEKLKAGFRGEREEPPIGGGKGGDYGARYVFPKGSTGGAAGKIREVFFVYCQCRKIPKRNIKFFQSSDRQHFNVTEYAKKMELGNPRAGIYHLYEATGLVLPKVVDQPNIV